MMHRLVPQALRGITAVLQEPFCVHCRGSTERTSPCTVTGGEAEQQVTGTLLLKASSDCESEEGNTD